MNLKGKTALVTGGAVRVGKAITLGLARAGANVVINYSRDSAQAAQTAREAESYGVSAMIVRANIADWEQVKSMFDAIHESGRTIDVLVNNASLWKQTPFPTDSIDDWHTVTGILINGAFYVSNLAARDMLEKKAGAIVNIVDISITEAWPKFAAHVVGKSALMAMTRQFALDLAPYVRVNAVCPGPVLPPPDYSPEKIAKTAAKTLLGRWGTPEDISKAVNFMIESDYINAESVTVDGGQRFGHRKLEHG
jgi:NAD(P)-dependent dehydrogenase (short-subunit alcohol dehydrogenase family)